jgi:hypothetical protein
MGQINMYLILKKRIGWISQSKINSVHLDEKHRKWNFPLRGIYSLHCFFIRHGLTRYIIVFQIYALLINL